VDHKLLVDLFLDLALRSHHQQRSNSLVIVGQTKPDDPGGDRGPRTLRHELANVCVAKHTGQRERNCQVIGFD
jgi:hypothetical protein